MNVDILAVGVHPDDIELSAAGTLLAHIAKGYSVGLCDLTQGELGTRGTAELRLKEAEQARLKMGAKFRVNLNMGDGFFEINKENIYAICKVVRKYKPKIVLANAISDRHPDHGRAARLVREACFYSGLSKIIIEDEHIGALEPHRPDSMYHYIQDRNLKADIVFDISEFMDQKMACIHCFSSQFYNPDTEEPQTPISSKEFLEFIYAKNASYARDIGVKYAEAFTVNRNIGVSDLFDLK